MSEFIQNELLFMAGALVKEDIIRNVTESKFLAIMANEMQDRAKREQLAIMIDMLHHQMKKFRSVKSLLQSST